jgi:two-component system sensor histidine kinase KdpD
MHSMPEETDRNYSQSRDPNILLAHAQAQEPKPLRGRLKVFFGYAAGVGKTYAMLDAAHEAKNHGQDVIVGYIEPHTRPATLALLNGLEQLPVQQIPYKGIVLREFDLDAALKRNPDLILVDELAHTNAPACRHRKRWQDIDELLHAGIDVYTTVNVQHLESLNDIIFEMTRVRVRETVPDHVFNDADIIELIDIEPDELLTRLEEGKIYRSEHAQRAIGHFFNRSNLVALREIALRHTADQVYRRQNEAYQGTNEPLGHAKENLLVCISPSRSCSKVIRAAARMAEAFHASLTALYIQQADDIEDPETEKILLGNLALAENLGASVVTIAGDSIAEQIVQYANAHNITRIIIGRNADRLRFFHFLGQTSILDRIIELSGSLDVYVIPDKSRNQHRRVISLPHTKLKFEFRMIEMIEVLAYIIGSVICGLILEAFHLPESNVIMVLLLGVILASNRTGGLIYGIAAAILGVFAYNFFFLEPRFTFSIRGFQYIVTFFIMLFFALATSTLYLRYRRQADLSAVRQKRSEVLSQISQKLQTLNTIDGIGHMAAENLSQIFQRSVIFYHAYDFTMNEQAFLYELAGDAEAVKLIQPSERAVANWVFQNGKPAGSGSDTLPGAAALYLPVLDQQKVLAVIGLNGFKENPIDSEQRLWLNTVLTQVGIALQREYYAQEQHETEIRIARERIRSNLLRAISHDLRSPLTSIAGAASVLLDNEAKIDPDTKRALVNNIHEDALWLNRLVENILSITRLDSDQVQLKKEVEVVEDVINEAVERIRKRDSRHTINMINPPEMLTARWMVT